MATIFDPKLRVLLCTSCASPVQTTNVHAGRAPVESRITCGGCGTSNTLAARDDSGDLRAAQQPARLNEARRIQALRAQDGTLVEPPPPLVHLLSGQEITGEPGGFLWRTWTNARHEAAQQSSYAAAERLYFLTAIMYGQLFADGHERELRAVLETALDHVSEPQFRAALHGMMARSAARAGAFESAAFWLSLCSPHSDDIHADSAYRSTAAYLAAAQRDYASVLRTLGTNIDDVPIADNSDLVCGMLRADALEKTGKAEHALQQVSHWLDAAPDLAQQLVAKNRNLQLCRESMARAVAQRAQLEADVVRTKTGYDYMNPTMIVAGVLLPLPIILLGAWLAARDPGGGIGIGHILAWIGFGGPLVLGGLGKLFSMLRRPRPPVLVRAPARLVAVSPTGIRINKEPVMELRLRVEPSEHAPFIALHKRVVPQHQLHEITPGVTLPVTFERDDRRQLVLVGD